VLVMPAIDLREGACVQLVGGSYAEERVREPDPVRVAARWRDAGFTRLHVVDLDAATGVGRNDAVVRSLLGVEGLDVQVGGGLRSTDALERALDAGAVAAVVGTRALEDPSWIREAADRWPFRLVAAVDVRDGRPVVRGWTRAAALELDDALDALDELPLAALLVTCVDVEGRMAGPDFGTLERVRARTSLPLVASGGITTLDDLRDLRAMDVWGAVVGMALYTGTLDPRAAAEEFGR
jgi:phosphoribosylformimino-5-aminoimidazole carboxamide ribotide isomerase